MAQGDQVRRTREQGAALLNEVKLAGFLGISMREAFLRLAGGMTLGEFNSLAEGFVNSGRITQVHGHLYFVEPK